VTLGWFFFLGRAMVFGMALDAAVFERIGSLSRFIFRLPVVRLVSRHSTWIRNFFDLPDDPRGPAARDRGATSAACWAR
jgi:hypothetical protein